MEKLIPTLYGNFGRYRNQKQMIPNAIDGCLPVRRRLLLGVHNLARTSFKKTASVLGYVMQHWHPHAEASGAMAILVQDGFVDGQGQWGSRLGIEEIGPAATRYTEVKANEFIEEIALKYVKYVPWERDELDPEPVVLPTMIPLCLFCNARSTPPAFGFKSNIPTYKFKDLLKRLLYLEGRRKKITITPYIDGCEVLNSKEELEEILTNSTGKITVRGLLHKDPKNYRIYVRGWSYDNKFSTIYKYINKQGLLDNGDVVFLDESTEEGGYSGTNIRFEVARTRNRSEIYKKLEKSIENAVTSAIHYQIYLVSSTDGRILEMSVDQMLSETFKFYKNVIRNYFNESIKSIEEDIKELNIIEKIKKYLNDVMKLKDVDEIINKLSSLTKEPEQVIREIIDKYKIRKLMTVDTDKSKLENKLKEFKHNLNNIDEYTINEYEQLEKKL